MHRIINESLAPMSIGAANTTIVEEDMIGYSRMFLEIRNAGANAISGFAVVGMAGPAGSDLPLYSTSADFTLPSGTLVGTSSDLTALAGGNTGWLELDVSSYWRVKIVTRSANHTTLIPYGSKISLY